MIEKIKPLLEKTQKEVPIMLKKQEFEKLKSSCESTKYWVENGLKNKNIDSVVEYRSTFEVKLDGMKAFISMFPEAASYVSEGETLLKNVAEQMGAIITEKEVEKLSSELKNIVYWFNHYLDKKDDEKAVEHQEKVEVPLAALKKYSNTHAKAKEMCDAAEAALKRLETEIGGIIIEKQVKSLTPAAESAIYWLEQALEKQDVGRVQTYVEQVEQKSAPLRKFTTDNQFAAQVIAKADMLLAKVKSELGNMIIGQEVNAFKGQIQSNMNTLENALNTKDVQKVVTYREKVIEQFAPFKAKYAQEPLANAMISHINTLVQRCEIELGPIIAQQKLAQVEKNLQSIYKLIENDMATQNTISLLSNILKLNQHTYPLRIEYANYAGAILAKVDEQNVIATKLMSDYVKNDIAKIIASTANLKNAVLQKAYTATLPIQELASLNKELAPLRRNYLYSAEAMWVLFEVDKVNLAVYGRIAMSEDDIMPSFDMHWKTPQPVQDAVKALNKTAQTINSSLTAISRLYVSLGDSNSYSTYGEHTYDSHSDSEQKAKSDYHEFNSLWTKVAKELSDFKKQLENLIKADASIALVPLYNEAIAHCEILIAKKQPWQNCNIEYSFLLRKGKRCLHEVDQLIKRAESASKKQDNQGSIMLSSFRYVEKKTMYIFIAEIAEQGVQLLKQAKQAASSHDVDASEADHLVGILTFKIEECIVKQIPILYQLCIEAAQQERQYQYDAAYGELNKLKGKFPHLLEPPMQALQFEVQKIKDAIAAEKKRKEEERRLAEEAALKKQEEMKKKAREDWVEKFKGGQIVCSTGETWTYTADGILKYNNTSNFLDTFNCLTFEWTGIWLTPVKDEIAKQNARAKITDIGYGMWILYKTKFLQPFLIAMVSVGSANMKVAFTSTLLIHLPASLLAMFRIKRHSLGFGPLHP